MKILFCVLMSFAAHAQSFSLKDLSIQADEVSVKKADLSQKAAKKEKQKVRAQAYCYDSSGLAVYNQNDSNCAAGTDRVRYNSPSNGGNWKTLTPVEARYLGKEF